MKSLHPRRIAAPLITFAGVCLSGCSSESQSLPPPKAPVRVHPVFHTALTGRSSSRPAIQVDILDASEIWFLTAELYLAVQSSRFPSDTWVLLPLNVGEFAGCRARFLQLPFEVEPGDVILWNLLDDDELTSAQERLIIEGCRTLGYCVVVAGTLYSPAAVTLISPAIDATADALGQAVVQDFDLHKFDNYGTAEFIVPDSLPGQPQQANKLTILDDSHYARVVLKISGPNAPLQFSPQGL